MHAHCACMHSVQAHYAHDSSHACLVIPIDVSRCFGTYIPTWICLRSCIFRSVYAVVIYVACKRLHVSIHSHMYVLTCMCLGICIFRPVYVAVLYCARKRSRQSLLFIPGAARAQAMSIAENTRVSQHRLRAAVHYSCSPVTFMFPLSRSCRRSSLQAADCS